jgi:hypothetical protein
MIKKRIYTVLSDFILFSYFKPQNLNQYIYKYVNVIIKDKRLVMNYNAKSSTINLMFLL